MRWLVLVLLVAGRGGRDPIVAEASLQFAMERPIIKVSYRFDLREDGTGTYTSSYPPLPPATPGETVEVPLMLHAATAKKIFEQARATLPLHGNCETKVRNIAQTGVKTLTYKGADGSAACTWNYSDKAAVNALQEEFFAMATTLDAGRRLKMEQRYNRLELDREMNFLVEQVKAGQAQGLENIAKVLQGIVDDPSLLERVRARATTLLQMSVAER